jgi:hypothetical protein
MKFAQIRITQFGGIVYIWKSILVCVLFFTPFQVQEVLTLMNGNILESL